ncbi:hypothetical protein HY639_04845 [Candidatus Woesearchaeota archaeon]|nr:hypothetical protein [Candidatus Woesearchaeota archaeon]
MAIDDKFLQEAMALIQDKDLRLGILAKYKLQSYAEDYSRKIKENPASARKVLLRIHKALAAVLQEK